MATTATQTIVTISATVSQLAIAFAMNCIRFMMAISECEEVGNRSTKGAKRICNKTVEGVRCVAERSRLALIIEFLPERQQSKQILDICAGVRLIQGFTDLAETTVEAREAQADLRDA